MVLELNASDDRGIDVVREQIKTFASTKQIFALGGGGGASRGGSMASYKLIILDEADAMTNTAQMALRRIMEKYTTNTRFCIIANYSHKLSPALLSRCTRFRFSPLKEQDIRFLVDKVVEEEDVKIIPEAVDALVRLSKGDMRRALNVLQACHASSMSSSPRCLDCIFCLPFPKSPVSKLSPTLTEHTQACPSSRETAPRFPRATSSARS
jgi:replication factor C subunit 3/5